MTKRLMVMAGNAPENTPSGVSPPITLELHGSDKWLGFKAEKSFEDRYDTVCHENKLLRYGLAAIATKAVKSLDEAAKLANTTLKASS